MTEHITGQAITQAFISPNESDSNGESANVVDALFAVARAIDRVGPLDRERFVRDNAVSLVADRDQTIERQRNELDRLNKRNESYVTENKKLRDELARIKGEGT